MTVLSLTAPSALDMSSDSRCLLAETIILGREAMGEHLTDCHFTDNWRLYRDGRLFHAESLAANRQGSRDYRQRGRAEMAPDY